MFSFITGVPSVANRPSVPQLSTTCFVGRAITAPRPRPASATVRMSLESLQERIQEEIKNAREAASKYGKGSKEAAVAWDTVEELEAEASHLKAKSKGRDALDDYCEENPEADECRTYDT